MSRLGFGLAVPQSRSMSVGAQQKPASDEGFVTDAAGFTEGEVVLGEAVQAEPLLEAGADAGILVDDSMVAPIASTWDMFWAGSTDIWLNVCLAQEFLGYVHVATGLPWWGTIVGITIATRILLFPVFLYQQKVMLRLQTALPLLQEVEKEFIASRDVFKDPAAMKRRKTKMKAIYKEHQCHPWRLGVNMLMVGPFFVSYFFGIKNLHVMHPDFALEGVAFVSSLAAPDPYCVLPALAALSIGAMLEVATNTRKATMDPMHYKMQIGVQRILMFSFIPLLIGLKYPAGVFVYWLSNNSMSLMQILAMNQSSIRKMFGLPPVSTKPQPNPFAGMQILGQPGAPGTQPPIMPKMPTKVHPLAGKGFKPKPAVTVESKKEDQGKTP